MAWCVAGVALLTAQARAADFGSAEPATRVRTWRTRNGLPSDSVTALLQTRDGFLWIGTSAGLARFDGMTFTRIDLSPDVPRRPLGITALCEDSEGHLFVGTQGEGLFKQEQGSFRRLTRQFGVLDDIITSLATDRRGDARRTELVGRKQLQVPAGGDAFSAGSLRWKVRRACHLRRPRGQCLAGHVRDGLVQLCSPSVRIMDAGQNQLPSLPTCLALDPGGRACVGPQRGGLFVGQFGRFERLASEEANQPLGYVSSLCTSSDGIYGLRSGRSVHFTTADGLGDNAIPSMGLSQTNSVWFGPGAGTLHRVNAQGLDRLEDTLVSSGGRPTAVISTGRCQRWLGTHDGRVIRDESGSLTEVFRDSGHHAVLVLYSTKAGWLLCGTAGAGLTCINGKSARTWTSTGGLPNDFVAGLIEDDTGILGMVTAAGICRVRRSELEKAFENPKLPIICELVAWTKAEPDSA